jgi:signal peptidase II
VFGIIFFDQLSKWLVVIFLKGNESAVIIENVFQFTYLENRGAAFGMLSDHRWVFLIISAVALIGITVYMIKWRPASKLAYVAISFIVGGGIGNMIDRIWLGYVIDFIDFCAFPKIWSYVFNVADSFVCVGAGLYILYMILSTVDEIKKEKAMKAAETEEKIDE